MPVFPILRSLRPAASPAIRDLARPRDKDSQFDACALGCNSASRSLVFTVDDHEETFARAGGSIGSEKRPWSLHAHEINCPTGASFPVTAGMMKPSRRRTAVAA